ncbi:zinc dependent phospholipase C family protein [Anaerostipes sp.]|uniref:zinc dependent phospholipase C family protein n=1 Tax=Anaerostipes sp. TaxID=1872530 RepID=UPI0025BB3C92|nr:zinc dependent phospholipase C family protein [Anaerostipes sp.]MBS7008481.1 zinc dependent phospholipase C family protein [Anaerostipes sp.]
MRKKSHISLAGQIMDSLQLEEVFDYKLPFYIGSIWPDCRPSFITTPHTFDITYDKIENQLDDFVADYDSLKGMNMRRCAKLGVIIHYIADYFTYPHNSTYEGNVKDHCFYERDLKHELKEYLSTEEAMERKDRIVPLNSTKGLSEFIKNIHAEYMLREHSVADDIQYIVDVCTTVVMSILNIIKISFENVALKVQYA